MPGTTLEDADVRARAARDVRHLGDPDRPGAQPGHDERDHQHQACGRRSPARWSTSGARSPRARQGDANCWCEPGRDGKCWQRGTATETVHHILKGGEDSIGALEAIQRVYFNIGSCSEQCWVNHLTDLRQLDPQRPQFRPDAVRHRPVPARLPQFPRDRGPPAEHPRLPVLEGDRRHRSRARPRQCAAQAAKPNGRLHATRPRARPRQGSSARMPSRAAARSSPPTARAATRRFPRPRAAPSRTATSARRGRPACAPTGWATTSRRWPPKSAPIRCRALHSNHMAGHVWQEYGSETLRARPPDPNIKEPHDGGRGYYRNISLLSVWAHAPFMHNNAIGPELCGKPANKDNDFYRSPYVDAERQDAASRQGAGVLGLRPDRRGPLQAVRRVDGRTAESRQARRPRSRASTRTCASTLGPRTVGRQRREAGARASRWSLPAGTSVGGMASFQHKAFVNDMIARQARPDELAARLVAAAGRHRGQGGDRRARCHRRRDREGPRAPGRHDPPPSAPGRRSTARAPRRSRTRATASARTCPTPTRRR